ncbi:MAG: VWA domain-containing protein, partial [Crocinitomicaceae bacterium]|nr:VWA domain-containing protein [Crocinitomicaceae bacterium]
AMSNNDKVGAIFVSDQVERYIPPKKGKKHALVILRELIELKPKSKGTDLNAALKFFRNTQKKRSIAFVISDFMDNNDFIEGLKVTRKKHDMVAIRLVDPSERELPSIGIIQLFNAETGETTWVNSNSKQAKQIHADNFNRFEEKLFNELTKSGLDYASICTDADFIKPLVYLFQNR